MFREISIPICCEQKQGGVKKSDRTYEISKYMSIQGTVPRHAEGDNPKIYFILYKLAKRVDITCEDVIYSRTSFRNSSGTLPR